MHLLRIIGVGIVTISLCVAGIQFHYSSEAVGADDEYGTTTQIHGQLEVPLDQPLIQDPIDAYHQQMREHTVSNRFMEILAQYRASGDLQMMGLLIDSGLQAGEYTILREELAALPIDTPEIAEIIGPHKILKTLFTIMPLHVKSYEPLKNIVDTYHETGLIQSTDKDHYYSMVALAKGHLDDFEYFTTRSAYSESIALMQRVQASQAAYSYAPDRWSYGLYAVAMYDAGRYQVSANLGELLRKNDPDYLLGHQIQLRNSMKLQERNNVDSAAKRLLQLDDATANHPSYQYMQAVSAFAVEDYARSLTHLRQLKQSDYAYEVARYELLIALQTDQYLLEPLKQLSRHQMQVSDYYAISKALYPGYDQLDEGVLGQVSDMMRQCQSSIQDGYGYVCLLGKAGLLYHEGDADKSRIVLEQLTRTYPTHESRELLGVLYDLENESKRAKQARVQAYKFTTDTKARLRIRARLRD